MRWLITNRNQLGTGFGGDFAPLTYWTFDHTTGADIALRASWTQRTLDEFRAILVTAASAFPDPTKTPPENQRHVTLFVHGYNNSWTDTVARYDQIAQKLFDDPATSLGELISFDWPSKGSLLGYLPDREEARKTADDLTTVLSALYDWMAAQQIAARADPANACRARTSVIAHSMGNYVLEYALNAVWTRKNRPLLVSLLQEVIMVAADVDNDLFRNGENVSHGDGEGLANMSYRITALYTGRDAVLGSSAGLKHFGKRRLGRSGLDPTYPVPDNVWDIDCTNLLNPSVNGFEVHGEYFNPNETKVYDLFRALLQGEDRSILIQRGLVPLAVPRQQQAGVGAAAS